MYIHIIFINLINKMWFANFLLKRRWDLWTELNLHSDAEEGIINERRIDPQTN